MPGGRHFWQSLHKYRTANLSAGNTLCWFGASCFGKWGILPAGIRNPTCPPVPADRRKQAAADISGRRKLSGRHGICTDSVLAAAVCAGNRIQAGNYFPGSGSAVYDGRCLLMNETARKLMKRINDASFAMDDVILYLDTHPDDSICAGVRLRVSCWTMAAIISIWASSSVPMSVRSPFCIL